MAAEKNNEYWKLRDKHGRDKLFEKPQNILEEAQKYFEYIKEHPWLVKAPIKSGDFAGTTMDIPTITPYTMEGFCNFVGINKKYFYQFTQTCKDKLQIPEEDHNLLNEFIDTIEFIEQIMYEQKFTGAAIGVFKENLISKEIGQVAKSESKVDATVNNVTIFELPDNGRD